MTATTPRATVASPAETARAVAFTSGYVLIVESLFAALAALVVGDHLEAGFRGLAGGLLGALQTPGAPLVLEGLSSAVFGPTRSLWAPLLVLVAVHACAAPLVQLVWLAGLAPARTESALRVGLGAFLAALRLRVLLLVPALFALVGLAILVTYGSLIAANAGERTRDLVLVGTLALGAVLFTPLRVLADLGHGSLVRAALAGEPASARRGVHDALRGLSLRAYVRWAASVSVGLAALALGVLGSAGLSDLLALLLTQLAAYIRYASRGAWLASALAPGSEERRFGSRTRNSAPPPASSALAAEMVPP